MSPIWSQDFNSDDLVTRLNQSWSRIFLWRNSVTKTRRIWSLNLWFQIISDQADIILFQVAFLLEEGLFQLTIFFIGTDLAALRFKRLCNLKALFHIVAGIITAVSTSLDPLFPAAFDDVVAAIILSICYSSAVIHWSRALPAWSLGRNSNPNFS